MMMMMLSLCIHGFPPSLARLSLGDVLDTTSTWALAHLQVTALLEKKCRTSRGARIIGQHPLGYRGTQVTFLLVFSRLLSRLLVFSRSGETLAASLAIHRPTSPARHRGTRCSCRGRGRCRHRTCCTRCTAGRCAR